MWEKLPAVPGRGNPCVCCPPIGARLHPEAVLAVGFGTAEIECDGEIIVDGEAAMRAGKEITCADAEVLAARDPEHDWRIVLLGPLHGETYQRHGADQWMLVETNMGFA